MTITKRRINLTSEVPNSIVTVGGVEIGTTPTWVEVIKETKGTLSSYKTITSSMYEGGLMSFPMSEGTGSTVKNIIPAYSDKSEGSIFGATWEWDDEFGYVLTFDGSDCIKITDDSGLYTSGPIMIETVFKLNSLNKMQVIFDQLLGERTGVVQYKSGYWGRLVVGVPLYKLGGIQLRINRNNKVELIRCHDGTNNMYHVEFKTSLTKGIWYYLAAGYDGTNYKVYIDNVDVSGTPYLARYPTLLDIDRKYYLYATFRSIGIYNRFLTADERKQHYELSLV